MPLRFNLKCNIGANIRRNFFSSSFCKIFHVNKNKNFCVMDVLNEFKLAGLGINAAVITGCAGFTRFIFYVARSSTEGRDLVH